MNKILKISFCLLSVCLILVSMIPTAFANPGETGYYPLTFSKPTVTDYSGYVELLWEDSNGIRFVSVVTFCFIPCLDESVSSYIPSDKPLLRLVQNGSQYRIGVSTNPGISGYFSWNHIYDDHPYMGTLFIPDDNATRYVNINFSNASLSLIGVHYYGTFYDHDFDAANSNEEFYVTYAEDSVICYGINELISALYVLIDATDSSAYASQLEEIISSLNSFEGSFEEFESYYKTQMMELIRLSNSVLGKLDTLIQTTDYIYSTVDNLYNLLLQFEVYIFDIWIEQFNHTYEFQAMNQKLDRIIELLTSQGDSEFTDPDTSNLDGYYDVEHSLLDDSNVDPSQVLNIELNQNALSAIWNLVDRVLNVNPKVFGAVIIILALGILALILGR